MYYYLQIVIMDESTSTLMSHGDVGDVEFNRKVVRPTHLKPGDDFDVFLDKFESYVTLVDFRCPRLDLFLLSLVDDPVVYKKLSMVKLSSDDRASCRSLIRVFRDKMRPYFNSIELKDAFHSMKQGQGETIDGFIDRLESVAKRVFPGNSSRRDGDLVVRFMAGIRDPELRKDIMRFVHVVCRGRSVRFRDVCVEARRMESVYRTMNNDRSALFSVLPQFQDRMLRQNPPPVYFHDVNHVHAPFDAPRYGLYRCNQVPASYAAPVVSNSLNLRMPRPSRGLGCFNCGNPYHVASACWHPHNDEVISQNMYIWRQCGSRSGY